MKVYILKDSDFEHLLTSIDRDPRHGERGGSSQVLSTVEEGAHDDAHRFYNYQVRTWINLVQRGDTTK